MLAAAKNQFQKLVCLLLPCLFLLCQSCTRNRNDTLAHGFFLDLATVPAPRRPLENEHRRCGDMAYIVATATGNGRASVNGQAEMPLDQFALRIREILRYRAFKLVYVKGDPRVSWSDFTSMVDHIWPEAEVLSLITPEVERLSVQEHCLAASCGSCENLTRHP